MTVGQPGIGVAAGTAFAASRYLREFAELLLRFEVTDAVGAALDLDEAAAAVVRLLEACRASGAKVMLVGNGGSAAIASHMQNDLCVAVGVRAAVFNEAPLMTALSNDRGYASVFERLVLLWAQPGDVLIAISSSGRSENILRAARRAASVGCHLITFSGFGEGNPLRRLGEVNFYLPSRSYGFVEMAHSVLGHFITDCAAVSGRGRADSKGER